MRTLPTHGRRILAAAWLAMHAGAASAFFDVQVLAGKRWYELKGDYDQNVAAQEFGVAAHLDPIPAVPVAFGLGAAIGSLEKGDLGDGVKEAKSLELGLDLMAWVPMVPFVTPYGRLKYPFLSTVAVESNIDDGAGGTDKYAATHKLSGPQIGVGAKWSPLPVLKLLVEVQRGMQKIEIDEFKVNGTKGDVEASGDAPSNAFFLGIEMGL